MALGKVRLRSGTRRRPQKKGERTWWESGEDSGYVHLVLNFGGTEASVGGTGSWDLEMIGARGKCRRQVR